MYPHFYKFFTLTLLFACSWVIAQPPRGPLVVSPQVHTDKRITFRYLAPTARQVLLDGGQFGASGVPMTRDSIGIWSVTVGPIKPDIYPYGFKVDGVTVMDPANVNYFPNERFKASLVDVPSEKPALYDLQNVTHGTITYEYYPSVSGITGRVVVYTPPGYDKSPTKKYPVYYLISGTTDTEETFFKVGHTNLILDNLIAQGKAVPMIVVMPYGNIAARIAEQSPNGTKPADPTIRDAPDAVSRAKAFEDDLLKNLVPYVEKNYRAISSRDSRAIGGFSRGGGQTLRAAFGNMDKFAWVCSYASYLSPAEMDRSFSQIGGNAANTNNQLKLLWLGIGTEDFLYKGTVEFMDYLTAKKVSYKSFTTDGGHTWMNVKKYLTETLPLLFR
ncbi:alpha/beta hydrolase-fold protein [Xanthocytophaga agilis]|uniref:Alpha/beta hydrolase-fold protein n=1 Tax=Xanthocytophaga agilis TaxID=3048010 RepID=A0AAE3RDA0_9BACT|nr:alpha/beta hydrolase-fold protein [Xanthocytophaga agilis]MDJ1506254.1 alpha/beta hydrolase-fold protein [Xanthocytophaga agilis]